MKTTRLSQLLSMALILLSVGMHANTAQAAWETVIPSDSMTPANFDAYWEWFYPWGQTHNGSAKMYAEQVTLTDVGETTIEAVTPDPYGSTYKYASGSFNSKIWIRVCPAYPEWEIKGEFKAPTVQGAWPAFWPTGSWSWPPEIDILEYKGDNYNWFNTYDGGWETKKTWVSDAATVWHEYRCHVKQISDTDVSVDFYLDGVWQATHTGSKFVDQPMDVIVNLQMEGSSGSPGPTSPTYYYARNIVVQRDVQPVAPLAPTRVSGAPGDTRVDLTWRSSASATSYNVKRSTTRGGPYTTIATTVGETTTSYTDTAVVNGTTYYYVVSAVNAYGESPDSAENNFTPTTTPLSQGKPTTASTYEGGNEPFDGNDGNFSTRWTASSGTYPQWWQVDLGSSYPLNKAAIYWYASADRSYKYKIEVSDDGSSYTTVVDNTANSLTQNTVDDFSASGRYVRVTVTGVSPSGGWAAFYECQIMGEEASTAPAAPSSLTASAVSSSQIDLTWTDNSSDESGFKVERSPDGVTFTQIATVGANVTSYSDAGLSGSTTYYYRVRAYNSAGDSAYSNTASATTFEASGPNAPSNLSASAKGRQKIDLAWTDNSADETKFEIERSSDNSTFTKIAEVGSNVTSYSNTGLSSSTTYYYRVRACNSNGCSAYSNTASATTK